MFDFRRQSGVLANELVITGEPDEKLPNVKNPLFSVDLLTEHPRSLVSGDNCTTTLGVMRGVERTAN
jgi:hypothetical protein